MECLIIAKEKCQDAVSDIESDWEVPTGCEEEDWKYDQIYHCQHSFFDLYNLASKKLQNDISPESENIKKYLREIHFIE